MPRIRSIKPVFFTSRAVRKLSDREKLVWVGLWTQADDEGRLLDEPGILAGQLWALSLTERQIDVILTSLSEKGRVVRYEVAGDGYLQVTNWPEHQKISKPTPSILPPPPIRDDSRRPPGASQEDSSGERKGKERKGGEAPPTPFCANHPGGTDTDCRACGDARRAFDAWKIAEHAKPTLTPVAARPGDGHEHVADEFGYCPKCGEKAA